jgi:hypothetical protein
MHRSRSRRLTVLCAAVALLVAATAYVSHIHSGDAGDRNSGEHCDLCLQFAGAAGTPTPVTLILGRRLLVARLALAPRTDDATSHYQARSHRSRAPPSPHLI